MVKRAAALLLLLGGCGWLADPLSDQDIARYVAASGNVAQLAPQLDKIKRDTAADSLYSCTACYPLLEEAAVKAGYKDLTSFALADIRILIAVHNYLQLEMAKMVATLGAEVTVLEACKGDPSKLFNGLPLQAVALCYQLTSAVDQLAKTSKTNYAIGSKLSQPGDLQAVGRNEKALREAMMDKRLDPLYGRKSTPEAR